MSHEIESIAWVGATPWHGLGVKLLPHTPIDDFIAAAGLDWELIPYQVGVREGEGEFEPIKERIAWVRSTDKKRMVFSGPHWKPLQNRQGIHTMAEWLRAGGLVMDTMGSLRGGRTVWALARLTDPVTVSRGDNLYGYLLLTMQHQLGACNSIRQTSVRVVCANMLAMAEGEGADKIAYSQTHLQTWDIDKARDVVESAISNLAAAGRRAKTLHNLKLSIGDAIDKVLLPVFSPNFDRTMEPELPAVLTDILQSVANAPGAEPDTGWGILNGVTHYADHVAGRSNSTRLYNAWYGQMSDKKTRVEKKLLQLAE